MLTSVKHVDFLDGWKVQAEGFHIDAEILVAVLELGACDHFLESLSTSSYYAGLKSTHVPSHFTSSGFLQKKPSSAGWRPGLLAALWSQRTNWKGLEELETLKPKLIKD